MSATTSKTVAGLASEVSVTALEPLVTYANGERPPHHLNDRRDRFQVPWPSFNFPGFVAMAGFLLRDSRRFPAPPPPEVIAEFLPSFKPTWAVAPEDAGKIKATWLGHACFLVELAAPAGASRGPRVIFDPVFSARCSPVQFMGPARYVDLPCTLEELPAIDAIVISHNHYDHMDAPTLRTLQQLHNPHIFTPLNNDALLQSLGFDAKHAHCLDWWDRSELTLFLPAAKPDAAPVRATATLTCTPAQHVTNRTPFDRGHSLVGSWALASPETPSGVFFGGDTGYRTVREGEDEEKVPRCPAFKEIGEKIGGFELALLPIGAYEPRKVMSCVHSSPSDAVEIFKDVRAKRALAMHWGTWVLTTEPIDEPPKRLREACERSGIAPGVFDICGMGETRVF